MSKRRFYPLGTIVIVALGFSSLGGNCANNDTGPGTALPPHHCSIAGKGPTNTPPALSEQPFCDYNHPLDPFNITHGCFCANYDGTYPPGVFDWDKTKNPDACGDDDDCEGCSSNTHFAWPDCAFVAETSGRMSTLPAFASDDDDDYHFDICPDRDRSFVAPFNEASMEIRSSGSFFAFLDASSPRVHLEVQDCRYYDGEYQVPLLSGGFQKFSPRPIPGDLVAVAGDWVVDDNHPPPYTEIHEARALAVTKFVETDQVLFSLVSFFFADQSGQQDNITLDIPIPRPASPVLNQLKCERADDLVVQTPRCPMPAQATVHAMQVAGESVCRLTVQRKGEGVVPFGCQKQCGHDSFAQRFPDNGCNGVFAGAIRASWKDPGDLWLCRSCACSDPSSAGATIAAPVQGCAREGLDPASAADRQEACNEVCGGVICGAAPACEIGSCSPGSATGTAELIARSACDPTQGQPAVRVTEGGDYRATIVAGSTVRIHAAGETSTKAVTGAFHFNVQGATIAQGVTIDFSDALLSPEDFALEGHTVTQASIVTAERLFGTFTDSTHFTIPAGIGVFGVRGFVNGASKGFNVTNPQALSGTIDIPNRRFTLHIDAIDPAEDSDRNLHGDLTGIIDDVPPVADAGGPSRVVECTSPTLTPAVLDASRSRDPDPGDRISHYQWFSAQDVGLGNMAQLPVSLPFGESQFVLHVYDQELGADSTVLTVKVVDTTPPKLEVTPSSFCMWPPNHRRVRFTLGKDFNASAVDTCDVAPTVKIVSVTSNEPDNGLGDGDTMGDISFGPTSFCVRRERSGLGTGRQYTVTVEARDASGNASHEEIQVLVPHDHQAECRSAGTELDEAAPCE